MALRLVVGLGNPGPRYARTRHNLGFRLVEALAGEASWRDFKGLGRCAQAGNLLFAEPGTFMNESGRFVGVFADYRRIPAGDILVCFDDASLPLGTIRLRSGGSAGGQKGMASIIEHMGTQAIPRLRLGLGAPPEGRDWAGYVLGRFSAPEEKAVSEMLDRAAAAVRTAAAEGLGAAMNSFNAAPAAETGGKEKGSGSAR